MPSSSANRKRVRGEQDAPARLLAAAEQMLDEGESYTEISIDRLATRAGLSRSSFYLYFDSKTELIRAWLVRMRDMADAADAQSWLGHGANREDLRVALELALKSYEPHAALVSAAFDTAVYDGTVRAEVDDLMERVISHLRVHIETGQRDGSIDATLSAAETAAWLAWMVERGLHQLIRGAGEEERAALLDTYTDVIWNTLYALAPDRHPGQLRP